MIPKSALEKILLACRLFPLYINKAAMTSDPIERVYIIFQYFFLISLNCLYVQLWETFILIAHF